MTLLVTFLLAFGTVLLVILAMAIGVLHGRKPISGSCGGLGSGSCELCSGSCTEEPQE
ncbi:MAG: hypothetical protein HKM98_08190 [Gammaproteobacteria bacterium]|nr:hypothetical protein [Gammaproteobacteria bacterium]